MHKNILFGAPLHRFIQPIFLNSTNLKCKKMDNDNPSTSRQHRDFKTRSVRPPKGLKGKEIGLWYRDRQRDKKYNEETRWDYIKNKVENRLNFSLTLSPAAITCIRRELEAFKLDNSERYSTEFKKHFEETLEVPFIDHIKKCLEQNYFPVPDEHLNNVLLKELKANENSAKYQEILSARKQLPIYSTKDEILRALDENQIVLISGETGCGKTTQVPQFILDFHIKNNTGSICNIICTQPRRISAIAVSERVAWERAEPLGISSGYKIRLENVLPRSRGSMLFCTTGTLLRQMESDPMLENITYIILDEIHERTVETDILMGLLKQICLYRKDLKVILMSATFCAEKFANYFGNCPIITIHGTLFPVEEIYLEDVLEELRFKDFPLNSKRGRSSRGNEKEFLEMISPYAQAVKNKYSQHVIRSIMNPSSEEINVGLLKQLIFHIASSKPDGAILVFLPGYSQISALYKEITQSKLYTLRKYLVYPLHSMLPTADQKAIFKRPPPDTRKIILATNIAETSITIDDVVYVINTGKTNMQNYNIERNLQTLDEEWVSLANSKQRRGRAGRVQPGVCYHLFTRPRERFLDEFPTPEILKTKLEGVILSLKLLHIHDVEEFVASLVDVPPFSMIENSMKLLRRINAVDNNDRITPLGLHLARLPVEPQVGKMILMAALFKCIDPISSVAASLSFKDAFYIPIGKEQEVDRIKQRISNGMKSDHLMLVRIMDKFREVKQINAEKEFCYDNFLSLRILNQLEKMAGQFCEILQSSRFLRSSNRKDPKNNVHSGNDKVLRAVICAGLYPNVAFLKKSRRIKNRVRAIHNISTPEDGKVQFHPSSINANESSFESKYFVYYIKQKSSNLFLYDSSMITPLPLVLFGDNVQTGTNDYGKHYISVASQFAFACDENTSELLIQLRNQIDRLLQKKALYPGPIEDNSSDANLLQAITLLLTEENLGNDQSEDSE